MSNTRRLGSGTQFFSYGQTNSLRPWQIADEERQLVVRRTPGKKGGPERRFSPWQVMKESPRVSVMQIGTGAYATFPFHEGETPIIYIKPQG